MQFRDLKKQYEVLKNDIDAAMIEVAESSAFINGKPVKELEAELGEYVGAKHCITCANGTEALTLGLKTWNICKGDAVFVPDFTFFASAEVISLEGATPVFVDVEKATFNMDSVDLEKKINKTIADGQLKPKVIITVDLFGLPTDYRTIRRVADKFGLLILEDGAQGFGGDINGKKACSFGDISTTSFFPAKPLGCYGDGGAVFTDNDDWATLIDSYRVHGKGTFKYDNVRVGLNSRLDTLQAAILKVKFRAFKKYELADINKAAAKYDDLLKGVVTTPFIPEGFTSSRAQYTIQLRDSEERDHVQAKLKENNVPAMVYYPTPMHSQTVHKSIFTPSESCPVSEQLCKTVLSLPLHPYISEEDIALVSNLIKSSIKK